MIPGNQEVLPALRGDGAYTALRIEGKKGETFTVEGGTVMPTERIQQVLSEDLNVPVEIEFRVSDISNLACRVLSQLRMDEDLDITSVSAAQSALTFKAPNVEHAQRDAVCAAIQEIMSNEATRGSALAASIAEEWMKNGSTKQFQARKRELLKNKEPFVVANAVRIFQGELLKQLKKSVPAPKGSLRRRKRAATMT